MERKKGALFMRGKGLTVKDCLRGSFTYYFAFVFVRFSANWQNNQAKVRWAIIKTPIFASVVRTRTHI